jgi:hypothetical protein
LALIIGVGLGVACGAASRSTRGGANEGDDGTGIVARLSRKQRPTFPERPPFGLGGAAGGGLYGAYDESSYNPCNPRWEGMNPCGGGWYGGDIYGGAWYGSNGDVKYPAPRPSPMPVAPGYGVINVVEPGALTGVVTWVGAKPPAMLPAVPGATQCGAAMANPTARISARGEVAGTVVYLADIRRGKGPGLVMGGTLDLRECDLLPRVQVAAPIGLLVSLTNRELDRRALRVSDALDNGFDVSLAGRATDEVALEKAGAYRVSAPGAHPGVGAWIMVASHPYYTVTDEAGRFRLDDIPPGDYVLAAWHEPVATGVDAAGRLITGGGASGGDAVGGAEGTPLTAQVRVTVKAFQPTTVKLELRQ